MVHEVSQGSDVHYYLHLLPRLHPCQRWHHHYLHLGIEIRRPPPPSVRSMQSDDDDVGMLNIGRRRHDDDDDVCGGDGEK
jgi:hypothetical protein